MKKRNYKLLNEEEIKTYIAEHEHEAKRSDSGLYYCIKEEGTGAQPEADSNVTISYVGYMTNGDVFDYNESLEINMSDVVAGWTEGIQYFKEGGEGILFIPAHLGYGNTDYGSIPGGSVLVFDIKLIKVD